MTGKELRNLIPDNDNPVVIFNDGACAEWYGVEQISADEVIVKPEITYILFAGYSEFELRHVEKHYERFKKTKKV